MSKNPLSFQRCNKLLASTNLPLQTNIMSVPQIIETLVKRYERSAVLRALVQLVPLSVGSAVDTALMTRVATIRADRTRVFFDELAKDENPLHPTLLENNEFLHCYFATSAAALRTQRIEKIQSLARLLRSSTEDGKIATVDEYEEFLNILADLSHRELSVLVTLDRYEAQHPLQADENDLQRANRFWEAFVQQISQDFSIELREVDSVLTRLNRSGCYETFTGGFFDLTLPLFD
ncbi:hypothetical protein, partial [Paraburkholderia strydomiana]|uniref:hypothetical protein n=1 Tax=Paraburkholderia strydomiana TaxID=1245417 RepID=UPI001BEACAB5